MEDIIKELTVQSVSSLLRIADDRSRWAAITTQSYIGVRPSNDALTPCDFSLADSNNSSYCTAVRVSGIKVDCAKTVRDRSIVYVCFIQLI